MLNSQLAWSTQTRSQKQNGCVGCSRPLAVSHRLASVTALYSNGALQYGAVWEALELVSHIIVLEFKFALYSTVIGGGRKGGNTSVPMFPGGTL